MIKHDESSTWLGTAMMAFIASCGYFIGIFVGNAIEVITGLLWLPLLFSTCYLITAFWLNKRVEDSHPADVRIPRIEDVLPVITQEFSDMHEIRINTWGQSFIEDQMQDVIEDFNNLDELYNWCKYKQDGY